MIAGKKKKNKVLLKPKQHLAGGINVTRFPEKTFALIIEDVKKS